MAWIGIECGCGAGELEVWAGQLRRMSSPPAVVDFLVRAARLVSGASAGNAGGDRMLEIESRAAAAIERRTADARLQAQRFLEAAARDGCGADAVFAAAGLDGWRAGAAAADKNGGVKRRRRAGRGTTVYAADGVVATAERGKPALTPEETLGRDARYGASFEGWCATQLVKMGFKMRHVARGVGLDVTATWRCVSGYGKHWKRQALLGVLPPEPGDDWKRRLATAVAVAEGQGLRGRCVVRSGGRDCGVDDLSASERGES